MVGKVLTIFYHWKKKKKKRKSWFAKIKTVCLAEFDSTYPINTKKKPVQQAAGWHCSLKTVFFLVMAIFQNFNEFSLKKSTNKKSWNQLTWLSWQKLLVGRKWLEMWVFQPCILNAILLLCWELSHCAPGSRDPSTSAQLRNWGKNLHLHLGAIHSHFFSSFFNISVDVQLSSQGMSKPK